VRRVVRGNPISGGGIRRRLVVSRLQAWKNGQECRYVAGCEIPGELDQLADGQTDGPSSFERKPLRGMTGSKDEMAL